MWINLQDKQKSIQTAWSQSNTVDGSISCINQRVDGGGGTVICPCWWGALSGLTLEPGPSSITGRGTYIVFRRFLRLLYDQQDPDTVCLWRHTSYPDPAANPHPSCSHPSIHFPPLARRFPFLSASSHQFPLYPLEPSFCFSIRFLSPRHCFIPPPPLWAPPTLYLIASVKRFFLSHFDLFYASLSPLLSSFFSIQWFTYSPNPLFPEVVDWRSDGMMSALLCQRRWLSARPRCGQFSCIGIFICSHASELSVTSLYKL